MKNNTLITALEELKQSDKKLVLWGGAACAKKSYSFLKNNDIIVDAIAVSKKYHKPNSKIEHMNVVVLEDYVKENPDCNIFVAFAGYKEELAENIKEYIHKFYCIDMIGVLALGEYYMIDDTYLSAHGNDLEWLKNELSDDKSKKAFDDFIHQKSTGVYEKDYTDNQYFDNEIIRFDESEIFVDCGAYTGDTVQSFITNAVHTCGGGEQSVYAFEPDEANYLQLLKMKNKIPNLHCINKGVWNCSGILKFSKNENMSASSAITDDGEVEIEVSTIDEVVGDEKVTFIKMDIEGAELNALKGAEKTILAHKPKLAICIYHKPEDLYEIPRYIKSLVPEYKLYCRNHSPHGIECVLYAIL
jgi:FkbM family methyltransferase